MISPDVLGFEVPENFDIPWEICTCAVPCHAGPREIQSGQLSSSIIHYSFIIFIIIIVYWMLICVSCWIHNDSMMSWTNISVLVCRIVPGSQHESLPRGPLVRHCFLGWRNSCLRRRAKWSPDSPHLGPRTFYEHLSVFSQSCCCSCCCPLLLIFLFVSKVYLNESTNPIGSICECFNRPPNKWNDRKYSDSFSMSVIGSCLPDLLHLLPSLSFPGVVLWCVASWLARMP